MKILLEIPDNKAISLLEVLKSISYVKVKTLSKEKAQFLVELKESAEELQQIKAGKKQARNASDFLNEL